MSRENGKWKKNHQEFVKKSTKSTQNCIITMRFCANSKKKNIHQDLRLVRIPLA